MTEELKTLKDLNVKYASTNYEADGWGDSAVRTRELKSEAMKHLKDLSKPENKGVSAVFFIKNFFNITEKDASSGGNE